MKIALLPASLLTLALTLTACTRAHERTGDILKVRNPASVPRQPATEMGETWTSADETNSTDAVNAIQRMLIKRTGASTLMKRDAHPKHHGCVKAFLKLQPQALPARDRVGIFAHDGDEYPAWIRFSNGDPDSTKADSEPDVRGMAVKVMGLPDSNFLAQGGVEENNGIHDFVMMNSPVFFIKDSEDYAGLMNAVESESSLSLGWFMVSHPTTAFILQKARGMNVGNPLHVDYFSATPYRLGTDLMRFSARSCVPVPSRESRPDHAGPAFLWARLAATLQTQEACFDFLVQAVTPGSNTPVEDPTAGWSTSANPYVKVATLRIPKQDGIGDESRMNFCENVSFNPWRAPEENRPLGAINRVRLQAYGQISDLRHEHNRIPALQPRSHEICTGETAPLCKKP